MKSVLIGWRLIVGLTLLVIEATPIDLNLKKFIRLETILTDQQLAEVKEQMKATTGVGRYWKYKYNLFRKYNARFCACGEVGTTVAIFQTEGATIKEIYCSECIRKEKHLKTPEINVNNFDQYFRAGKDYGEVLEERRKEASSIIGQAKS